MRLRNLSGVIAALVCSAHAAAGTYLEASRADLREPMRPPENQKMWFDGGSVRLENERGDAVEIFKNRTLYLIEPTRGRYARFDESSLGQLLNGPPTAQRAAVANAALRPGATPAPGVSAPERTVRATSRTEPNGGETCTVWEVAVGGSKVQELCVVPVSALPGGPEILADMRQIGALIRERGLGESLRSSVAESWGDLAAVDGIPVLSRTFEDGRAAVEIRITAVRSESVPFTAFDVPAGFKRRSRLDRGI